LPGNKCLFLNGEVKCRKTCTTNAGQDSCPFGYTCTDTLTGSPPFCVPQSGRRADGTPLVKKDKGQWGSPCLANGGIQNKDCDGDQGFFCYGTSPTDADAYCTRYDCVVGTDCGPGFWCAKINQTPNVTTAKHSTLGEVQNVCLRRAYCATCAVDLDCPDIKGTKQHCVPDDSGVNFCAPECEGLGNCPNEAKCIEAGLPPTPTLPNGPRICFPRAKVCVGDGSLCAPCRVDTDCGPDGACIKGEYTTEKACAQKVSACTACPKTIASPKRQIGCSTKGSDSLPANYCVGLYSLAGTAGSDIGCWTPDR
jgi:hypothetical protein